MYLFKLSDNNVDVYVFICFHYAVIELLDNWMKIDKLNKFRNKNPTFYLVNIIVWVDFGEGLWEFYHYINRILEIYRLEISLCFFSVLF